MRALVFSALPPRGDAALRAPSVSPSLPAGICHSCSCTCGHPRVKGFFVSKSCMEIPRCREQKLSSPGEQNILSLHWAGEGHWHWWSQFSEFFSFAAAWLGGFTPLTSQAVLTPSTAPTNSIRNAESFSPSCSVHRTIFVMAKTCGVASESRDLEISPVDTPFIYHHHKLRKHGQQYKQLKNNFSKVLHALQLTSTCVSPMHRGH